MSALDRIIAQKRWEVATQKRLLTERELRDRIGIVPRAKDFAAALRQGSAPRVVAEFKRASPSKGAICASADPAKVACEYADNGAVAISVLTDARWFWGSLQDLWRIRESVALPLLRKEFVVDPYQIVEARAYGADAVLLLCSVLDDQQLFDFAMLARELGMTAVVEAHDENEIDRALAASAQVIGVNNRNLRTLVVTPGTAERLRPRIPADRVALAESGVKTAAELARIVAAGFDACLIGEALMSAPSPGAALRALRQGAL